MSHDVAVCPVCRARLRVALAAAAPVLAWRQAEYAAGRNPDAVSR